MKASGLVIILDFWLQTCSCEHRCRLASYPAEVDFIVRTIMPHVFISYVRENSDAIDRLANELKIRGVTVWLDRNDIEPGARWRDAIKNAIRSGKFFVACFSKEYNERDRSYMNEELTLAIDQLRERPSSRTWFIPVLINQTAIPSLRGASARSSGRTICSGSQVQLCHAVLRISRR